ncbi:MAG: DoxX family protein, partial [Janthinobacterium lividum]
MTLLRAGYRTMLASYFISSGVKAVRNPAPLAELAEPLAQKVVPFVKKYAPDEVSAYVPEDPKTLVRLNGALQIAGGLALATGKGRRVGALLLAGSLVPSTLAKYPFWSQSGEEAAASRSHFAKNVSLLGGVLLASRDTEGRPGIAWRAQAGGQAIAKSTSKATKKLTRSGTGDKLAKQASSLS